MIEIFRLEALDEAARRELLARPSPLDEAVQARVKTLIARVRAEGDAALYDLTLVFDGVRPERLAVPRADQRRALERLDREVLIALGTAKTHLEKFHERQRLAGYELEAAPGVTLGQMVRPFRRVGLYVPRNLPSSLLMAGVPARLAGACELVVCSPPGADGKVPEAVLAAAALLDVDELYALGGAQAVAALAYGTETIRPVEKIVGPGNAYVTAAKALVRDRVGIDLLAGPSEILLIVDRVAGMDQAPLARWALAELTAQLEHGPETAALLLTRLPALARAVAAGLAQADLRDRHVAVLTYEDPSEALAFANAYAPEHLGLWGEAIEARFEEITSAGSVFLGPWSPVACGDYASGTNHVLPTAGSARFGGGLTVHDFYKKTSYQRLSPEGLRALAPAVSALARVEGLAQHARTVALRLEAS